MTITKLAYRGLDAAFSPAGIQTATGLAVASVAMSPDSIVTVECDITDPSDQAGLDTYMADFDFAPVAPTVTGGVIALPPPRVRQASPGVVVSGFTRQGAPIDGYGSVVLSIDGLPEALRTDPSYRCQIELGRYMGKRKKRPQGFYHPSPWIGGVTPHGSGGTRGGAQNVPSTVDRPSEWPVAGLGVGGGITLPVATVFGPWCQLHQVTDLAGTSADTVSFSTRTTRGANRPPGYKHVTLLGVFAFRYAFFDPASKRWVSGPWSENVYVRPKGWPLSTSPQGVFPALDTALPQRATFTQIACTCADGQKGRFDMRAMPPGAWRLARRAPRGALVCAGCPSCPSAFWSS